MSPGSTWFGVGYSSSPQAILDLVAGRLQVMVADFTTAMPHVKAGKLRVLGVTTAKRTMLLPEVPPIAETLAGFDITSWNGIFAPAGTSKEIIARLERDILDILSRTRDQEKIRRDRIRDRSDEHQRVQPLRARADRVLG